MKLKPLLIAIPSMLLTATAFASHMPADSVGVENQDGKKVILHKLDPKDNYYSIGRRYNIKPAVIIQYNNNASLHVGQIIKVPTEVPFVQGSAPTMAQTRPVPATSAPAASSTYGNNQPAANTGGNDTQQYKVSAGETLYAIAKRFGTTVDDITKLNNLKSNSLSPGQILLVHSGTSVTPAPAVVQQPAVHPADSTIAKRDSTNVNPSDSSNAERRYPANRYGLFEKNEKGIATWMDDAGFDPNKKLVLHRTAPIGTVIKITNPMTNRTTFAKVVGRFTDNETTKDVLVVMTKNAAESIGALDKRFRVNISYGVPE